MERNTIMAVKGKDRIGVGRRAAAERDERGTVPAERAGRSARAGRSRGGKKLRLDVPAADVVASARLVEVCLRFGLPMTGEAVTIAEGLSLPCTPGTITLVTGPSGSGKSLLLAQLRKHFPSSRLVERVPFPLDVSVLDAVAPTRPIGEALGLLTACGMGEPRLWIRRFDQLSAGEQFRARLARAISLHRRSGGSAPLLCDEFATTLHRRLAKAMAFNLRKLASRERIGLVVATSRDDLERDLRPDCVVRLGGAEPIVEQASTGGRSGRRAISFVRRLRIERGSIRDYAEFAPMHYRRRDVLGFVDRVFVMREGAGGDPLGVVVYGHGSLELSLRNRGTGGRFVRQAARLNRELRVLKRLVIHPDVRGCGLAHWLANLRTGLLVGQVPSWSAGLLAS